MIYENTKQFTIQKGCPWYEMQQTFGPPNVNWCEPTYCQLVNEPATAWSNIGIILPGILIHYLGKNFKAKMIRYFGLFIFVMGILSFVYHATNNYGTQFLDFVGMYLYTGAMITINLQRSHKNLETTPWKVFYSVLAVNIILFWILHFIGLGIQFSIVINIAVLLILEFKNRNSEVHYKYFFISLAFIAIAQTFSLLDHTRVWCEPENNFLHGHALWHVFAGIASLFSFIYYKQFNKKLV